MVWRATRPAIYRGAIAIGGWRGGMTEIFSEVVSDGTPGLTPCASTTNLPLCAPLAPGPAHSSPLSRGFFIALCYELKDPPSLERRENLAVLARKGDAQIVRVLQHGPDTQATAALGVFYGRSETPS